jgi:hypothetical protein
MTIILSKGGSLLVLSEGVLAVVEGPSWNFKALQLG